MAQHAIITNSIYDSYWSCVVECIKFSDGCRSSLGRCGQGAKLCKSLPSEVMGQGCIRPKIMMITLNSAAYCFQGPFSTSLSQPNVGPGYCSTVESDGSEVLCIFVTFHLPMAARNCSVEIPMLTVDNKSSGYPVVNGLMLTF